MCNAPIYGRCNTTRDSDATRNLPNRARQNHYLVPCTLYLVPSPTSTADSPMAIIPHIPSGVPRPPTGQIPQLNETVASGGKQQTPVRRPRHGQHGARVTHEPHGFEGIAATPAISPSRRPLDVFAVVRGRSIRGSAPRPDCAVCETGGNLVMTETEKQNRETPQEGGGGDGARYTIRNIEVLKFLPTGAQHSTLCN